MANRGIYIGMPEPSKTPADIERMLVKRIVLLVAVHAFVKVVTVVAIKKLS